MKMYWSKNHQPSRADTHKEIQKEIGRIREEVRKAYQFISDANAEERRLKAIIDQNKEFRISESVIVNRVIKESEEICKN